MTNAVLGILLLLLVNEQADGQESPSTLLVDLLQFHNPTGATVDGRCCDGSMPIGNFCPTALSCNLDTIVCLDFVNSGLATNWSSCPLGWNSRRTRTSSTSLFNYYSIKSTTPISPMQFELPSINDNSIAIKISVFYDNTTMLLNRFYTTFRIDMSYSSLANGAFQQSTLIDLSKNASNINQMIVGLKSYCRPTFYGKQCSVQCIANDDCSSSYSCDSTTGEKICSPGWHGPECTLANGSSTCAHSGRTCYHGGFCRNNQSACCCPRGYTGSQCEHLSMCTPGITCANGGQCRTDYDALWRSTYYVCQCPDGFTGLLCEDKQPCAPTFYGPNCTVQCSAPNSCSEGHFQCNPQGDKSCLTGWGPIETCTQKIVAPIFDSDCPVSTGCLNGGSCFNGSCCCPPSHTGRLCETSIDPCTNNPCQNNALCLSTPTGYRCLCSSPLYTGLSCEVNQNPCQPSSCLNGICQSLESTNAFRCICYPGYAGQFCQIKIDYCVSQPCENHGVCASMATGFVCTCLPTFTGQTCSMSLDPCPSGSCSKNDTLHCPLGLTNPPTCSEDINECLLDKEPCKNGGQCINAMGTFHCQCTAFYQGEDCSVPIDPCLSNPCIASNSVSCTSIMNNRSSIEYNCTCRVGFTGKQCETELNPCVSNPCFYGECIGLTPFIWSCICKPGWTGVDCQDSINECLSNPCLNAGNCTDALNGYQCECSPGFTGANCQTEINLCSSLPCQNNGTCVNQVGSHSCLCPIGWTGHLCEVNINECSFPLSCHPNATCIDLPGSHQCVCPSWLTGSHCLTAIDQCETFPCLNHGVCVNNYGSLPTCHCQAGFTGVYCEVNIDDCQATPCFNNGTCIDQINSFLCLCSSGHTGLRCQTSISQCNSSPCLNGGTCRDSYGRDKDDEFVCLCPPTFTGRRCEQTINHCSSFPCVHGNCAPSMLSYDCQCNAGYTGRNCESMIDQCSSGPCSANGTCRSLATRFSCCCPPGHSGPQCEQLVDICSTSPCSVEGAEHCLSTGVSSFHCLCKSGYSGRYCEMNINECLSQPCLNGGTCIDFFNSYQCICPSIYTGSHCELPQDQCLGMECLNGGRCQNNGTDLVCLCPEGFHGDLCELIMDYCQSQPCLNGGICANTEFGARCTCPSGVTGSSCETIIDQCESEPCENNGTCQTLIDKYVCLCPLGFMGNRCENERNECEPVNPCLNSGRCVDGFNQFSCICNPGFTGDYCETQIDQCQSNPCFNGGLCRTLINSFKCDCPQGYMGSTCATMINHCTSNPCLHNGLCIPLIDGYRCVCLDDYIGSTCEKTFDECSSNPCLNNGTCVDQIWNYTCQCPMGFTGSNCQTQIDYCLSAPCIKGLCLNKLDGYDCLCPSSSYEGVHCEVQINKCASDPCSHGGTCIDGLHSFTCLCPAWYSGLTCSERIDPCSSPSTCANNGTCHTDLDVKPYGHACQCSPGFTGSMCEVNVDDCASQPCLRGRCIDQINGFTCQCYPGYEGVFCDHAIDQCVSAPCQNNGVCRPLIDAYQCQCASGYHGVRCERRIENPCLTNTCLNNGTCTLESSNETQCTCLHGYDGSRCETKVNACSSSPCRHGTCQDTPDDSYQCSCPPGYTGVHCQTDINHCESSPCLHNGTCHTSSMNTFTCSCAIGYTGQQCQFGGYQCSSGPCLNNGTCAATDTGYQCTCPLGLIGNRCEIDIDECASMPCLNSGICLQSTLGQYQCRCPRDYTGTHCETKADPCTSTVCLNGGTCNGTHPAGSICSCSPGYTGASCEHQINHCLSVPCMNGTCVPLGNTYQCNCFPGYTGARCDSVIDYCALNPCFNNGTCINQATNYACQCPYGFQGRTCVIRVQACQSSPCLNGGLCSDVAPGLHNCSCPPSHRGDFCQLRDLFCLEKPCQNNGICLDTLNGYQCICQPGFSGVTCRNVIQPCLSNPCLNNARCENMHHGLSYQCTCPRGYAGLRCELEINWCSSNPCQNQGICISRPTSFVCLCPNSYTGVICQIPISNCSASTCEHGVPLTTSSTSCTCICSPGYTGSRCEVPINPCADPTFCSRGQCNYLDPGVANCTCPTGYDGLRCATQFIQGACASCPCLNGQCRTHDDMNNYTCDCYPGYRGKHCDISIDLCKPTPCLHGQCVLDDMHGYQCQCLPGATGRNCSALIDICGSKPCLNHGVCIQALNTYQCVCQSGYAGSHCEILINQCTSLICLNNGTCLNRPTKPPTAQCQCPPLFTGLQCQYPYAPCASQPCQNLGTCIADGQSSYTCQCPNGFSGKYCEVYVQVCQSDPCQNGGTCSEPAPFYYICQCPWPFYGLNCELMSDPCLSYPCRGPASQCISTSVDQNFTCVCSADFEGTTCSVPVDPCRSVQCQHGGSCIRTGSLTYSCSCPAAYHGRHCELELNPCSNHSCTHGLSIRTSPMDCECQCSEFYYGKSCEMNMCEKNPCSIGQCISHENYSYTCNCPAGFQYLMGVCADVNECRTIPGICGNGGRCLNTYGSYSCFCKAGFYGEKCATFDPCRSVSCSNGGTCMSSETFPYWQCRCSDLYTGSHCELSVSRCASNPCQTGTCQNLHQGDYRCVCPTSITGRHCETPILPCDSNPCLNNSTCLTLSYNNYTCVCPPLYTGLRCSDERLTCSKTTCFGNATCVIHPGTGEETCRCSPKRYGVYCEFLAPCATNPCRYGFCQNIDRTTYRCTCQPGYTGVTCQSRFDNCQLNRCVNGGTCSTLNNGSFVCACPAGFTGLDCGIPICVKDSCFNDGRCSVKNNLPQCQCPCGFTGSRCETPVDICAMTTCLNNGTRLYNSTACLCSCSCPSLYTGDRCQLPLLPINRTYAGEIVIPVDRLEDSSWEATSRCIDQVWNSLNALLVCPSPYTLVTPTSFYPYCYRINEQSVLENQTAAIDTCRTQRAQLVWFQSIDELQQQVVPALITHGLTRDFWTSAMFETSTDRWQWLLTNNNTRINIDPTVLTRFGIPSRGQSLYVSFNQSIHGRLSTRSPTEQYSTLCKLPAARLLLTNQTRSIDLTSQQTVTSNQSQVIIYKFKYTLLPSMSLAMPIQQPTASQYAAVCGAVGNPTTSVEPYAMDICGYFLSITDDNVQLLMRTMGNYYTTRRMSATAAIQPYVGEARSIEHYLTITGQTMTRIYFVIASGSSTTLGLNIEPLPSINDILNTISYRNYQQCQPHVSLNVLLPLKLCIPPHEIPAWTPLISKALHEATGQSNVNVMLKGVQEGVISSSGQPANIAHFLITVNGMTSNESVIRHLSLNPTLLLTIQRENEHLLCPSDTTVLLFERSIRDFHSPCHTPSVLEWQLNNALQQAGIYTMNITIFGAEEAVDHLDPSRQVYRLPNIFIRLANGTWLDGPMEVSNQLVQIFAANQLQRLTIRVNRLSKAYSYFYANPVTASHRDHLEKLLLILYNRKNSLAGNSVKFLHEERYVNVTTMKLVYRAHLFVFHDGNELDGRYSAPFLLSSDQPMAMNEVQTPLSFVQNQIPIDLINERHLQQISFTGKISSKSAEQMLKDYWQNPFKQGLMDARISIVHRQEYLAFSMNQFYTTITYTVVTTENETVPKSCFNATFIQTANDLCGASHTYLAQVPLGGIPSFIDLQENDSAMDVDREEISKLLTFALQKIGMTNPVSSVLIEPRFGLNMALINRVYYMVQSSEAIRQAQIQEHLKILFSSMSRQKYEFYPSDQPSVSRTDAHRYLANISLPLTNAERANTEDYLTSFNPRDGKAKIVHAESSTTNQTRIYLVFLNGTDVVLDRCDFALYYPGMAVVREENPRLNSLVLERSVYLTQATTLAESLRQLWAKENVNRSEIWSVQLLNQNQYICSEGRRSVRVDYLVNALSSVNLTRPKTTSMEKIYGPSIQNCGASKVRSIYLLEPNSSNKVIYQALEHAWQESNGVPINISSEFFLDSSYFTKDNETLTRLIYTVHSDASDVVQPAYRSVGLPNLYKKIPYRRYRIYLQSTKMDVATLSMINQAVRHSWSKANGDFFSANDVFLPSMHSSRSYDGQMTMDYLIGLRTGDIGDYAQPSETLYLQVFNETGLQKLVSSQYITRSSNEVSLDKSQLSFFPFDYPTGGSFHVFDWWILLIIVLAVVTIWLLLCLICYSCIRKKSPHRHHRKISRRPTRRIDVLAREQEHYLRPSISSLAFDGPYAESISSSNDDHQRISNRTISPVPELQVRRLSEQDWPHFAMHNAYGLPAFLSESPPQSTSSTRPL